MRSPQDPLDHSRTTRPHAGEAMKDTKNFPAVILLGVALAVFGAGVVVLATGPTGLGAVLAVAGAMVFLSSMAWFAIEHRRVRGLEDTGHPDASS